MYPGIPWTWNTLTREDVKILKGYLEQQFDDATVAVTIHAMSSFYSYIMDRFPGAIKDNPWRGIKIHVRDTTNERILSEKEVQRIIVAANCFRDKTFIRFLYVTQLRIAEAVSVRWKDIRRNDQGRYFCTVQGKGKKMRTVEVSRSVMQDIIKMVGKKPDFDKPIWNFTDRTGRNILYNAAKRAGLNRIPSPHWLRHTGATVALEHGAPLSVIQKSLGHSRITTTEKYIHISPEHTSTQYLPEI
jgi:integrase/recombinase XerD